MSVFTEWGSTPSERAEEYPCDALLPEGKGNLFRAITVRAPVPVVFRWLCQLRVAPYSYDWIDNSGQASPRQLTPGLEELARGQRVMEIFELVEFAPHDHMTLRLVDRGGIRTFGELAVTYRVRSCPEGTRLVVKLRIHDRRPLAPFRQGLLAAGDLIMMQKQLRTLKALAEVI